MDGERENLKIENDLSVQQPNEESEISIFYVSDVMKQRIRQLWKEMLGVVSVLGVIVFLFIKRTAYAQHTQIVDQTEQLAARFTSELPQLLQTVRTGDALSHQQFQQRHTELAQLKEQLPTDTLRKSIEKMQVNIALLEGDVGAAESFLVPEETAMNHHDRGTVALFQGYQQRSSGDLIYALSRVDQAISSFDYASDLSDRSQERAYIAINYQHAQQLQALIALDMLIEAWHEHDLIMQRIGHYIPQVREAIRRSVRALELRDQSQIPALQTCKEHLLASAADRVEELDHIDYATQQLSQYLTSVLRTCMQERPVSCAHTLESRWQPAAVVYEQFERLLESRMVAYERLVEITETKQMAPFQELCQQAAEDTDTTEESQQLQDAFTQALQQLQTAQQQLEEQAGLPDDQDLPDRQSQVPLEWENTTIEEIRIREQKWLEDVSNLQRDKSYLPIKLIEELFDDFLGDTTGFF